MFRKLSIVVVLGVFAPATMVVQAAEHNVLEEPVLRASRMIGLEVVDRQGSEKVGKVENLVVGQDGERITHVIVTTREAEGNAAKQYPVPIEALRLIDRSSARPEATPPRRGTPPTPQPAPGQPARPGTPGVGTPPTPQPAPGRPARPGTPRPERRVEDPARERDHDLAVRLNVTRDRLQEAPVLKADDLSVLADVEWLNRLAKFHEVQETTKRREQPVLTAKDLLASEVRGPKEEKEGVASLKDVVFELPSGRIRYGALTFARVEDAAEKLFPVPWTLMKITIEDPPCLTMQREVTAEMVRAAEGFAEDETWPATADDRWLAGDFRQPRETRVGEREHPLLR